MADEAHIIFLMKGAATWNMWRAVNPDVRPNLAGVDIEGYDLDGINLSRTNLTDANLKGSTLNRANMSWALLPNADMRASSLIGANFSNAYMRAVKMQNALLSGSYGTDARLIEANLTRANLVGAKLLNVDLREAVLDQANLSEANLSNANLSRTSCIGSIMRGVILEGARLIQTDLENADLTDAFVYGISTWSNNLKNTKQTGLKITPLLYQEGVTVDSLNIAQFIYLLTDNKLIRNIIDTVTCKVVLILGRFTPDRKEVLDAIRHKLYALNYIPIMFDFEKPAGRDLTETISTLAHISKFIIADISDARSIPQELERIVPDLPSVPIVPLLQDSEIEYGMFEHFRRYPWVLPITRYCQAADLLKKMEGEIVARAEKFRVDRSVNGYR